jgi:hypothetical protein
MSSEQTLPSARAKGAKAAWRETPEKIVRPATNAITHSLTSRRIVRSSDSHNQLEQLRALEFLPTLRKIQKVQNEPNPKNGHSAGAFSTRDKRQATSNFFRLPTPTTHNRPFPHG